jgi:hypothetical protein
MKTVGDKYIAERIDQQQSEQWKWNDAGNFGEQKCDV